MDERAIQEDDAYYSDLAVKLTYKTYLYNIIETEFKVEQWIKETSSCFNRSILLFYVQSIPIRSLCPKGAEILIIRLFQPDFFKISQNLKLKMIVPKL